MQVLPRVQKYIEDFPSTDGLGGVRAAMAIQLARKLDDVADDSSAGAAQATPGISKELRAVLDSIKNASVQREDLIADIFRES